MSFMKKATRTVINTSFRAALAGERVAEATFNPNRLILGMEYEKYITLYRKFIRKVLEEGVVDAELMCKAEEIRREAVGEKFLDFSFKLQAMERAVDHPRLKKALGKAAGMSWRYGMKRFIDIQFELIQLELSLEMISEALYQD